MQTIRLRSQVGEDGSLQVQLPEQLANQEVEIVLVYQAVGPEERVETSPGPDPLIGLFSGAPDLATRSEEILQQDIDTTSGWTWKSS